MSQAHWYRGYGLSFQSEIDLPELTPSEPTNADVQLRLGSEPRAALADVAGSDRPRAGFLATDAGQVLCVTDVAHYLVRDGREIIIDPLDGADPGMVRLFLIGSALGMLFHQRGQLVLHGAAIQHSTGLSVFVGPSGAGKSTLAAHLGKRGHAVLADDTLPVSEDDDGGFLAWPGSRVFKLWRDALEGLGETPEGHMRIGNRIDKHFYENPTVAADRPLPLRDIIVLERSDEPDPRLFEIQGLEALKLVNENAYRPEYVAHLGRETPHFKLTAAVIGAVRVLKLARPWDVSQMEAVLARLEAHWDGAPIDPPPPRQAEQTGP